MTPQQAIEELKTSCRGPVEALEMAIAALEKQAANEEAGDKYRWHYLCKDPNDLPFASGHKVEICLEGLTYLNQKEKAYCHGFIGYGNNEWCTCDNVFMRKSASIQDNRIAECFKVIAWREIEPFEEVEE